MRSTTCRFSCSPIFLLLLAAAWHAREAPDATLRLSARSADGSRTGAAMSDERSPEAASALKPFSEIPRGGLMSMLRTMLSTGAGRVDMLSNLRDMFERH